VEFEVRFLRQDVEVGVVVEDVDPVMVGDRGDHNVDRRHSVVPDPCELSLRVERSPFDLSVNWQDIQWTKLIEDLAMILSASGRVARLKQKRKTDDNPFLPEFLGDLVGSTLRDRRIEDPGPGGVIE
jgi:hypothetical protein